jgi:uncharacterized OB-fold protein
LEEIEIRGRAQLWSHTTQHYAAPAPFRFDGPSPYRIGVAEFADGLKVVGMLVGGHGDEISIGQDVELTATTLFQDDEMQDIRTWGFEVLRTGESDEGNVT